LLRFFCGDAVLGDVGEVVVVPEETQLELS
jgi:hypothetical protein